MDVRSTLARKHDDLVLVDIPAQADIAVAIVERVVADSGSSLSIFPPRYYAPRNIVRLRVTVTRSGESVELVGARWREDNVKGWTLAAQDIAAAIDAWLAQQSAREEGAILCGGAAGVLLSTGHSGRLRSVE